ncbi:MAG: hypothetical protein GEV28_02150 [Actinophytocola sp.]|uniref:hypothetical protein n=1 Tax=Actinophytocola sp. TaxID=1872138 RepID=UPI00132A46F5|nr:hypothetical protein [Actinophytocola sp.]MPZ79247.1 hypothetical protein [Actinophytocola sp.]
MDGVSPDLNPGLARLLEPWPEPDLDEQAFPFVTVDEAGFPHVMLLCTPELLPAGDALLVAIASTTARANLTRTGTATLIAADGEVAHYAKLRVLATEEHPGFACLTCEVVWHMRDSLGIPLRPMEFHATPAIAANERWAGTRAALVALRDRSVRP